jgi:hypothetical protein
MISINVIQLEDSVSVRVLRWPPEGRYPAQLVSEHMPVIPGESVLRMTARAAALAASACDWLRSNP